jgi:putative membrane protein insertion efficiency factor
VRDTAGVLVRRAVRIPAATVVLLLRLWQLVVSPVYGQTCRFYPSCSGYALEAVDRHGLVRGGWLALRRLGRCHPWNPGGLDPVPQRAETTPPAPPGHPEPERPLTVPAATVADHRPPRRAA